MGILNATPDSFYNHQGGLDDASLHVFVQKMVDDGADILDIGGQSTRPGSERIPAESELERVIPVIEKIRQWFPDLILSIDTYHSRVAEQAVGAGVSIVNDISGGMMDEQMLTKVGRLQVPYICMHMQGTPATMQKEPVYDDVVKAVLDFFIERTEACKKAGINDIILDPGFGFGKTITHNFQLLADLDLFGTITGKPVLAGLSRKSTVYKTLGISADEALNGTTVLNTLALAKGASILRVHDVKEAREAILLYTAYKKASR